MVRGVSQDGDGTLQLLQGMKLEFKELNADNWETCAKLTSQEDQRFVSSNTYSIAEDRKNGYGSQAMMAIFDWGRAEGFQKFITSTRPTNERMQNLLTKVGFITKHELDDGEWVYYLNE